MLLSFVLFNFVFIFMSIVFFFFFKLSCDYFAVLSFIVCLCFIHTLIPYAYTYLDCVRCCFLMVFKTRIHFSVVLLLQNQVLGIVITIRRRKVRKNWENEKKLEQTENMHKCIWYQVKKMKQQNHNTIVGKKRYNDIEFSMMKIWRKNGITDTHSYIYAQYRMYVHMYWMCRELCSKRE